MAAVMGLFPKRWARLAPMAMAVIFLFLGLTYPVGAAAPNISFYDEPRAITVDAQGNVYVTGVSKVYGAGEDFLTIKYSSAGKRLWVQRYNGSANSHDRPRAMVLDASGNVYVTGFSMGQGNGDYLTLKYSPEGALLWARRYDGPVNGLDEARAIKTDSEGNVYVTGTSAGSDGTGAATIKYSPDGDELWVRRSDGYFLAMAVDSADNVIVTGAPGSQGSGKNFAVVKYKANGDFLWAKTYGEGGLNEGVATGVGVDDGGSIYITGQYDDNFAVLKYSAAGDLIWVTLAGGGAYGGPGAMTVTSGGYIYLTGSLFNTESDNFDFITIKFSPLGKLLWFRWYNGTGKGDDEATAMTLDPDGNIYVAGKSPGPGTENDFAVVKYNSRGQKQWVRRYHGGEGNDVATAMALDGQGNIHVTGWSEAANSYLFDTDFATLRYTPDGKLDWVRRYDGMAGAFDLASGLVVTAQGTAYVTGCSKGTLIDYATLAYDQAGQNVWVKRYNGPANGLDLAAGLTLDPQGNLYVTGESAYEGAATHFTTLAYTPAGQQSWVSSSGGFFEAAHALGVDSQGNLIVTGISYDFASEEDFLTVKYNPEGAEVWAQRFTSPGQHWDAPAAMAIDGEDNVIVTGVSESATPSLRGFATVKYNVLGVKLWEKFYQGPEPGGEEAKAVATDAQGNIYVTGRSRGNGTDYDYTTIKYSPGGNEIWVKRYNGPGNGVDEPAAIAIDAQGNVYVTGRSQGHGTYFDYATIKYSPGGRRMWVNRYNGPGRGADEATALCLDGQGNVLVTGTSYGSGTGMDYATVKYNADGQRQWVKRYSSPGENWDGAAAVAVDAQGNVYVTGSSYKNEASSYDYVTLKYDANGKLLWTRREDKPGL